MQTGIHPKYYLTKVSCACGNTFTTRSTKQELKLDLCSACHPLFTGKEKLVDTEGKIKKFSKKLDQAKAHKAVVAAKKQTAKKAAVRAAAQKQTKKLKTFSSLPTAKTS